MKRWTSVALMCGCASVAHAVPVTITISATLPADNTPTNFSTSFSIDSNAATTDVYTSNGQTYYGYSAASLTGFGFTIDGASFTVADISLRILARGHSSDLYLNAPIGSGAVSATDLSLIDGTSELSFGNNRVDGIQPLLSVNTRAYGYFGVTDFVTSSVPTSSSPVPEPASLTLLCIGVFGLSAANRHRRISNPTSALALTSVVR